MLDLIHLFRFHEKKNEKDFWYRRVPSDIAYEIPDEFCTVNSLPYGLAVFVVPKMAMTTTGLRPWRFGDKVPKKGIHLRPPSYIKSPRTADLLRSTRGLLYFTNQYDPEWFRKPEDAAYWLGFNYEPLQSYYSKTAIVQDFIFAKKALPPTYSEGYDDAAYKI